MRLRRSLIITPGHRSDLHVKLAGGAQDVCILDLEDGVPDEKKQEARHTVVNSLQHIDWAQKERLVRINSIGSPLAAEDINVAVRGRPEGILLTKTSGAQDVLSAANLLEKAEASAGLPSGTVLLWALIESAIGLLRIEDICFAHPRMTGVLFGGGDLAVDLQLKKMSLGASRRTGIPSHEYLYGRGHLVLAARAAGIDPIDCANTSFGDEQTTRLYAEYSAQMGFAGSVAFSPRQAPWINETYSPAPDDLRWAREVIQKYNDARASANSVVVVVDGEMVDKPHVLHARQILEREKTARLRKKMMEDTSVDN